MKRLESVLEKTKFKFIRYVDIEYRSDYTVRSKEELKKKIIEERSRNVAESMGMPYGEAKREEYEQVYNFLKNRPSYKNPNLPEEYLKMMAPSEPYIQQLLETCHKSEVIFRTPNLYEKLQGDRLCETDWSGLNFAFKLKSYEINPWIMVSPEDYRHTKNELKKIIEEDPTTEDMINDELLSSQKKPLAPEMMGIMFLERMII